MTALLDRIRRFVRQHGLFGTDTRLVVRCRRFRFCRAAAPLARSSGGGRGTPCRRRPLQPSASRPGGPRRSVCGGSRAQSGRSVHCGSRRRARARALGHLSIETAARGADTNSSTGRAACLPPMSSRSGTRATIRPKHFLLRLVRGAGPRGSPGCPPPGATIVRPLLECGRQELRAYLASAGCRMSTTRAIGQRIPRKPRACRAPIRCIGASRSTRALVRDADGRGGRPMLSPARML
jgi:hypothetical protein